MLIKHYYLILITITVPYEIVCNDDLAINTKSIKSVDTQKTKVWGPGLTPASVILPVRYFFIHAYDGHGKR